MSLSKDEIRRAIYHCVKCKLCSIATFHPQEAWSPLCPSGTYFGFQAFYAPGRMEIFRELLEGEIKEPTEGLLNAVFACTLCGACYEKCRRVSKVELPLAEIFEEMRREIVRRGWMPDAHRGIAEKVKRTRNAYGEEEAFESENLKPTKGADVLYFIGCTARFRVPEIADAMLCIFDKLGVEYQVLDEEWCCCSVLMRAGWHDSDIVREHIRHNYDAICESGAKTVVFTCPGCLKTLKKDYAEFGADFSKEGIELLHATQFIQRLMRERGLDVKELPLKATYHDPCHLGRDLGIYEEPREVLSAAVEISEMRRVRNEAWCCGSGGGVKSAFNDFAVWSAEERLKEAEETGADAIVSACPFCKRNLRDAAKHAGSKLQVLDVVEILKDAL